MTSQVSFLFRLRRLGKRGGSEDTSRSGQGTVSPGTPCGRVTFYAGEEARTPRAPARAHRPPDGVCVPRHPLLRKSLLCRGGSEDTSRSGQGTPSPRRRLCPPVPPAEKISSMQGRKRGHLALRPGDCVARHPLLRKSLLCKGGSEDTSRSGQGTASPGTPCGRVPFYAREEARTPRAPARGHRPPDGVCVPRHPLLRSYHCV